MPDRREHFLFHRFGTVVAKPDTLVLRTSEKLGALETAPRVAEEAPVRRHLIQHNRHVGTETHEVLSGRLLHVRDPKHHPSVTHPNNPEAGRADMLFNRDRGRSSKN